MLILSPRAVERLETYTPAWPLPKIFRLTKGGKLIEGIFEGETINTPSMLCVEDYLDTLDWAKSIGGLEGADRARRCQRQGASPTGSRSTPWIEFLASDPATRSNTSVCLKIVDPAVAHACRRRAGGVRQGHRGGAGEGGRRLRHRRAIATRRRACASGAAATVEARRRRGADAVARLGLRREQGRAGQGGVACHYVSDRRALAARSADDRRGSIDPGPGSSRSRRCPSG